MDKATNNYCNIQLYIDNLIAMAAGFQLNKPEDKRELRAFLDKYKTKEYKETPLLDSLNKIA